MSHCPREAYAFRGLCSLVGRAIGTSMLDARDVTKINSSSISTIEASLRVELTTISAGSEVPNFLIYGFSISANITR